MSSVLAYLDLSALLLTIGFGLRINQKLNAGRILVLSVLVLLPTTAPLADLGLSTMLTCHFCLVAAFQLGIVGSLLLESADHNDNGPLKRAKDGS